MFAYASHDNMYQDSLNFPKYFLSFGSIRTDKFTSDMHTDNKRHELYFLTIILFFNILPIEDH